MTATLSTTIPAPAPTVGDRVETSISLDASSSATIHWKTPSGTDRIVREQASPWRFARSGSGWKLTRSESWTSFSPGSVSWRYEYTIERGGTVVHAATLSTPQIHFVSVIAQGEKNPLPAPLAAPRTLAYVGWPAAAAAVALAAAAIILLRRRKAKNAAAGTLSPDDAFERELDALEIRLNRSDPDGEFHDRLAAATKGFVQGKLSLPATKQTSSEVTAALRRDPRDLPEGDIRKILAICDGFRFARRETRREQALQALACARTAADRIRKLLVPREENVA